MTTRSIGPWITAQKPASRAAVRDRLDFLDRTRLRQDVRSVAGFPLVGLGGAGELPWVALPYTLTWTDANTQALEAVASAFDCYVEYGVYPHLKLNKNGQQVAAVQDWTTFAPVSLRPGYERAEDLLVRLSQVLAPAVVV